MLPFLPSLGEPFGEFRLNMSELALLVLLKIVYVTTGLVLCLIGKTLIEKKLETKFKGEGTVAKVSFRLITTSPGIVFLAAGLAVIATAIYQTFEIIEVHRNSVAEVAREWSEGRELQSDTNDFKTLVERVRTIRFASGENPLASINEALQRARDFAKAGAVDTAAVYVAIAIVTEPSALSEVVSDPEFSAVLEQPNLKAIIRARFELPLNLIAIPSTGMSPVAEHVLAQLRSLAKWETPVQANKEQALAVVKSMPNRREMQPKDKTIAELLQILDLSPGTLLSELTKPDKRWILDDLEILSQLEQETKRRIQNE